MVDCIMRSFITCTRGGTRSADGRDEIHTIFWLENLKGRDHLEDLGMDGKVISE
jgi:hypothetical protein